MAKVYKGIDISLYQGEPDFAKVRDAGIDFVIIKASQGRTADYNAPFADPKFRANAERFARTPGRIYAGSYHYLMARNVEEARREADFFVSVIGPYRQSLQLWAAVDVEDASLPTDKVLLTKIVKEFCDRVRAAGFRPMVYSSTWWLNNRFTVPAGVPIWEANWSVKGIPPRARAWQCGTGYVPGVSGAVDVNYATAIMGDADGDGNVNAKDITAMMRHMLGKKGAAFNGGQADFDRDGKVTAKDIIALMKALL